MLKQGYTNAAPTTVATTINSSLTTLVLTDASTFPLFNFVVLVESELMYCTSRTSNTLTVVRGVEGTTGAGHSSGVAANHIITAGALNGIKADLFAAMGHGRPPASGNTYGDEFDDESFDSAWISVQPSSPILTPVEQDKTCSILHPGGGSTSNIFHSFLKNCGTRSAGDWISMCYRHWMFNSNYSQPCIWFTDGDTYGAGNQVGFGYSPNESLFSLRGNTNFNTQQSFNAGISGTIGNITIAYDMSLKLVYQGSSQYDCYISMDGVSWLQTHSLQTSQSFTPTYCGFAHTPWNTAYPTSLSVRNFRTSF